MNAIKIIDEMIKEGVRKHNYDFLNDEETLKQLGYIDGLKDVKLKISSLPSDTQWIDKLEKELEEEDKDIDSLDDYYMGLSVGKTIMLNRVKREILPINN